MTTEDKRTKSTCLRVLIFMYFLFPFTVKWMETLQVAIYYTAAFIMFVLVLYRVIVKPIERKTGMQLIISTGLIVFMWLASLIIPAVYKTYDYSYARAFLVYVVKLGVLVGCIELCDNTDQYMELYIKACAMYTTISIIMLFPPIHVWYSGIVSNSPISVSGLKAGVSNYYTRFGLQGFSGFSCTRACTTSVMFCCYRIAQGRNRKLLRENIILLVVNFIGAFLYGRIGAVVSLICVFVLIFNTLNNSGRIKLFLILASVLLLLFVLFIANAEKIADNRTTAWIFEPFLNLYYKGNFSSTSTDSLLNMYFIPEKGTLLHGDGRYKVGNSYYMKTDVGWLRPVLFWGVFITIIYYMLPIVLIRAYCQNNVRGSKKLFYILSIGILILFELKGETCIEYSSIYYALNVSWLLDYRGEKIRKLERCERPLHT